MSRHPALRASRSETGAAAVEFGLVAIALLTLLTGIIQTSIYFWSFQVGAHAAREGARRYAVAPCSASVNDALVTSRVGSAAAGSVGITTSFGKGPGNTAAGKETGDEVEVTVNYSAPSIGGLVPAFPAITKKATARVEDVGDC